MSNRAKINKKFTQFNDWEKEVKANPELLSTEISNAFLNQPNKNKPEVGKILLKSQLTDEINNHGSPNYQTLVKWYFIGWYCSHFNFLSDSILTNEKAKKQIIDKMNQDDNIYNCLAIGRYVDKLNVN